MDQLEIRLISASVEVEVEVEAELGKKSKSLIDFWTPIWFPQAMKKVVGQFYHPPMT